MMQEVRWDVVAVMQLLETHVCAWTLALNGVQTFLGCRFFGRTLCRAKESKRAAVPADVAVGASAV